MRAKDKGAMLARFRGAGIVTRIKICGLFRPCDIEYVNEARPDWCGFIINFPKSRRSRTPAQVPGPPESGWTGRWSRWVCSWTSRRRWWPGC